MAWRPPKRSPEPPTWRSEPIRTTFRSWPPTASSSVSARATSGSSASPSPTGPAAPAPARTATSATIRCVRPGWRRSRRPRPSVSTAPRCSSTTRARPSGTLPTTQWFPISPPLIGEARPAVVYTHNLADKHDTHVAVALRTLAAIRSLPADVRPAAFYGCEVWRDLDWMVDEDKVAFDVTGPRRA